MTLPIKDNEVLKSFYVEPNSEIDAPLSMHHASLVSEKTVEKTEPARWWLCE